MASLGPSVFRRKKQAGTAGYTLHNKLKLVRGGIEFFELLEQMIDKARHLIHFQVYILDEDATGKNVARALIRAAQRGVKVFLMVDGYASKNLSKSFIMELTEAGIHFRMFQPLFKSRKFYVGRRLHHKVIVVDDFYSLVGGLNISDRYNDTDDGRAWLDWAILAEGQISEQLAKVCVRRYKMRLKLMHDHQRPTGDLSLRTVESPVRIRINDWIGRRREITNTYLDMFKTAKSHITIMSPYFLPGSELRSRMKQALGRGVAVKVIIAGISDVPMSKHAERYLYRWMFRNKVQIYEYQDTVLHGKVGIVDGRWMTIGSYNLNNLSAYVSVELNLDITDASFAKSAEERLFEIMEKQCVLITEEEYKKYAGPISRLSQFISYNLLRVALFMFTRRRE
ncbi:MAG TPA: phospholipase D-like domain-containing protein [Cyclobacteriaceae bacterium]|nr:phospholipase D-like domain-containing protein [Cyclobacteriaceae bacterium]